MLRSIQRRCRSLSPHTYRYKQRACANDGVMDEEDFASAVLHCAVRRFGAWQVASDRSGELLPSDALQHTLCRVTLRSSVFFSIRTRSRTAADSPLWIRSGNSVTLVRCMPGKRLLAAGYEFPLPFWKRAASSTADTGHGVSRRYRFRASRSIADEANGRFRSVVDTGPGG